MAKLILRSNYFKNEPAVHKSNYIKYLGTREGVEMNPETLPRFFYEDMDMHGRKENFMQYISDRPGAVHVDGTPHGLFSDRGLDINLEQVMDEVANHRGTVWINVISLKREDAKRLHFDQVEQWQRLLRSHVADISEAFKISPSDLQWYAAFHNEGHHPHVHMVVYSKGREGYLTKQAIQDLKSKFTNEIFKYELTLLYSQKTDQRTLVKEQARKSLLFSIGKMSGAVPDEQLILNMKSLGKRLQGITGKKQYGYLHKNIKSMIDEIADDIAKISEVKDAYEKWTAYQNLIRGYYSDGNGQFVPLSQNKEFRSIKNMIIREAEKLAAIPDEKFETDHKGQSINTTESDANVMAQKKQTASDDNVTAQVKRSASGAGVAQQEKRLASNAEMALHNGQSAADVNVASQESYPASDVSLPIVRLLKQLEKMFLNSSGKNGQSNSHRRSDSAELSREAEKKKALGQKADDHETEENKSYMTMV